MIVTFKEQAERVEPERGWERIGLCIQEDISVDHFVKPPNHASPPHHHPSAQVLIVLKGKLRITAGDQEATLSEGDSVYIPGNEDHVVANPMDSVSEGLDIFVPGRSFDFWKNRSRDQDPSPLDNSQRFT